MPDLSITRDARRFRLRAAGAALFALVLASGANAQFPVQRYVGTVLWVSAERLALALDDGTSVPIDLTNVDQGSYQSLRSGDRIVVTGAPSPERDRVIATAIEPAP